MITAPLTVSPVQVAGSYGSGGAATPAGGFGATLKRVFEDALGSGRAAEGQALQALQGEASATDVAVALSKAELTLQTATSIRDHVVQAYQDIMKMPI
jgi:flagellar hook-basal body complex protein FliE